MKAVRKGIWLMISVDRSFSIAEFFDFYHISEKKRKQIIREEKLLLNRQPVSLESNVQCGDTLALACFEREEVDIQLDESAAEVLYEDDYVLIVNKPSGMIIHSDGTGMKKELNAQVARYYLENGIMAKVRPIHRLDEETSGCVLYCKCSFFQPFFDALLSEKKIHRQYLALAEGNCRWKCQHVDLAIGKDRHHAGRQRISANGKPAVTDFSVIKRDPAGRWTLVKCDLKTGRTHQVRVHLSALHHPILSDPLYGRRSPLIDRLALHAYKLSWIDPVELGQRSAEAPFPPAMRQILLSINWGEPFPF